MAKTLHSPRRVVTALAILLSGGMLVGLAGAAGGDGGGDGTFRIPFPHGGDRASYTEAVTAWGETRQAQSTVTWGPEEALRTPDGWRRAHERRVESDEVAASVSVNGQKQSVHRAWVSWHDSATGRAVAADQLTHIGVRGSASMFLLGGRTEQTIEVGSILEFTDGEACDLVAMLRHGVPMDAPVAPDGCTGAGKEGFRFDGTERLAGLETQRLVAEADSVRVTYWFSPLLPEPVQVEAESPGVHLRTTLVGFAPGTQPWSEGIDLPADTPVPTPRMQPRQPWGPDDAGAGHPFPASAAWAAARDSPSFPDFRAFLAEHPDAHAYDLEYGERTEGSSTTRHWRFLVGDGRGTFHLTAARTDAPPAAWATDALGVPSPLPSQASMSFSGHDGGSDDGDAEGPTRLPDLPGAIEAWRAFTGATGEASWGLRGGYLEVGDPDATVSGAPDRQWERVLVGFGDDGRIRHLHIVNTTYRSSEGTGFSGITTHAAPVQHVRGIQAMGLLATPAGATSVGLLSLLLAIGYYLAPLAKSGGLALFSRVEGPALLQHPARRRIVEMVEAEPGLHYQELVRRLGIGQGATEHHLRKLVDAGLVARRQGIGFTCYFPPGRHESAARAAPALKSEGARRILRQIQARPGLSSKEVAAGTGLDPATVSHHVHRLQEAGLVAAQRNGRSLALHPTPAADAAA